MSKSMLIKIKRTFPLVSMQRVLSNSLLGDEGKRNSFARSPLKLGRKVNSIIAIILIAIIIVSVFAFMPKGNPITPVIVPQSTNSSFASPTAVPQSTIQPSQNDPFSQISRFMSGIGDSVAQAVTPRAPGTIESAQTMNSTIWGQVAANAWRYFQPGVGVDSTTGLPYNGGSDSRYFTDWDLGVYIQAVIDANVTGLIGTDGAWNSSARLEKVVSFLENRELNVTTGYPYWFYQSVDGKDYHANSDLSTNLVDGVDTGRLLVALNNLKAFNSSLSLRINNLVYNVYGNRSNYAALVPAIYAESRYSTSIYAYYVESGFASFWPSQLSDATSTILNNIRLAGNVTTYGVSLPLAAILGDPLICSVFETSSSSRLMSISLQVYLAHEAYYNATGQYRAFSEGSSLSTHWTYEWVVLPDGRTWAILDESYNNFDITPIIYTKIAISFLALYNTTYAYNMCVYLEKNLPAPTNGYSEGVDENGVQLTGVGLNTNGLIIGAAKYAILNNP
jgi:hypothetical protein